MKNMTHTALILFIVCLFTGCDGNIARRSVTKAEVPEMELHTFKLPMNYTNQILEAFCHPTSTRIGEADCMLIYNHLMHAIGIIDLTHQRPLKQIKLKLEGENRIGDVRGIFSYKDDFILRSSFGFHRIDGTGNILSSWSGDHYLKGHEELKEYSIMIPELMTYFNLYNFAGYDECNGLTTFSIYKNKKENGEYPKKILVVDCHTCEVVDVIDVFCPERMKQEPHLGILGSANSIPHGDLVIYNFPASDDVYVYNRKTKDTRTYSLESNFTKPYYQCKEEDEEGLSTGHYFPLRYDALHDCFWRVQQQPKTERQGIADKAFSIVRISSDFQVTEEYIIPNKKGTLPYALFTEKQLLLNRPNLQGNEENVIFFYGINTKR